MYQSFENMNSKWCYELSSRNAKEIIMILRNDIFAGIFMPVIFTKKIVRKTLKCPIFGDWLQKNRMHKYGLNT